MRRKSRRSRRLWTTRLAERRRRRELDGARVEAKAGGICAEESPRKSARAPAHLHHLRGEAENATELSLRYNTVLFDGLSTHRLARPRPSQGVQEDPKRARGGGGAGRGPAVAAARRRLRPRASVGRRRDPRAHRRGTRGGAFAARGEPGAGAAVGAPRVAVPDLHGRMGRECGDKSSHLLLPENMQFMR